MIAVLANEDKHDYDLACCMLCVANFDLITVYIHACSLRVNHIDDPQVNNHTSLMNESSQYFHSLK